MAGKSPTSTKAEQAQAREDRLKAAMKANMARRKAQARVRAQARPGDSGKNE
jgi:hypothetical protein